MCQPPTKEIYVDCDDDTVLLKVEQFRNAQELGAGAYVKKPYLMEKVGVAIRDELNR